MLKELGNIFIMAFGIMFIAATLCTLFTFIIGLVMYCIAMFCL